MATCEELATYELNLLMRKETVSTDKMFLDCVKCIYEDGLDTQLKKLQRFYVEIEKQMDYYQDWQIEKKK